MADVNSPEVVTGAACPLGDDPVPGDSMAQRAVAAVREAQAPDPFRRVTVVVPSFGAARDVTRALARSGGAAGVAVRTPSQVVAELSASELAPRSPLQFPVLAAAVGRALDEQPGAFAPVAREAVTGEALARACGRLQTVVADRVDPQTPLHAEVRRVDAEVRRVTSARHHLPVEALDVALERLDLLGTVVLCTPLRRTETERRLHAALGGRGVVAVDQDVLDGLATAGSPGGPGAIVGTSVLHASDPDDEVRAVVRLVRERLAEGVPGHRIGVHYPAADPYLRLLHRAFAEAGIAVHGPGTASVGQSPEGRALVRLLRIDPEAMPRHEVLGILAEGSLLLDLSGGRPVSARSCERLTRSRVPVVGGQDWQRLAEFAEVHTAVDPEDPDAVDRDVATALALHTLVSDLGRRLRDLDGCSSWAEAAEQVSELAGRWLRPTPGRSRVLSLVGSLADLDGVGPRLDTTRLAEAVATRLDSVVDRVGEEGVGVAVGPIDEAVGRELDTVCVVGMAEGLLPSAGRPDPLVPEGSVAPPLAERLDERYRVLQLALLAGAHRVCTFPRGSMRGGGERIPSRWVLPTLAALTGRPVDASNWAEHSAGCAAVVGVPSFADAVLGDSPATETEFRLRSLAATGWRADACSPARLRRAQDMRVARRRGEFGRYTGDVSSVRDLLTVFDHPLAPTRLEDWAQSPYLFLLTAVLGVRVLEEPAETTELDIRDHGTLVHAVLQDYVVARLEGDGEPDHDLLMRAFEGRCAAMLAQAPGLVRSLWSRSTELLLEDLEKWYSRDVEDHADGWRPVQAESRFGRGRTGDPDEETVEADEAVVRYPVETGDGPRTLLLQGSIDRVDAKGSQLRVTDYKTGKAPDEDSRPTAADPTVRGTRFQLPLYAAAGTPEGGPPVGRSRYWYCTERGGFEVVSLDLDDSVRELVRTDVGQVVDAMGKGYFPLKGGLGSSRDLAALLGGSDLDRAWSALQHDPRICAHPAFRGLLDTYVKPESEATA